MSVALIGPGFVDRFFEPARDLLRGRGHDVRRFADRDALLADPAVLGSLEVLAALPAFRADRELFERTPRLRAIVSLFTGIEGFDASVATERGILIANGQIPENTISMAETAVMLILASLYDMHGTERVLRENLPRPGRMNARMLMRKTVGLIGFGQIAQAVATRLSTWDVRLVAAVRTARAMPPYVAILPLDDLLAESDVVVVATTLNEETRGLLGPDRLRRMKPDAVFVNIARGSIAADDDLAELARERPAMRLALDVFDPEPLRANSPLRDLPNAILTPHMIGHTVESQAMLPAAFLDNLLAVTERKIPPFVANSAVLPNWPRH